MMKSMILSLLAGAGLLCGQSASRPWEPLQFLIGKWKGAGGGEPGAGQGAFSFLLELDGRILVRRSFNQLASGQRHEDLMIVFPDGSSWRAVYFDSEGHTIQYSITFPTANAAVFESGSDPKYRLSYVLDRNNLNGRFDVGGKTYLKWTAVRESP